ncbi:carbonic anhydrase 2-like [Daphnia pulicaria]|uniref:carbonic anhydrase 2-like n=1 Tax=Daphnia pulicaria TaxID=35523 RepID=UPI001EEBE66D|nr:carbonic anhydrase 2-like [Daphnia pulicaria]
MNSLLAGITLILTLCHFTVGMEPTDGIPPLPPIRQLREDSEDWNYKNPNDWVKSFDKCAGREQSPIDLRVATAIRNHFPEFKFHGYEVLLRMEIRNNGHSVELKPALSEATTFLPYITGGGLNNAYIFHSLHFHWSDNSARGSEHTINSVYFPAELHVIHYNHKYGSFENAAQNSDGFAILAILIELERQSNPIFRHIVSQLGKIKMKKQKALLTSPIILSDILPDNTKDFYRYHGSLTTPNCEETVIWTVFTTPIAVSETQLNAFRFKVYDSDDERMVMNWRPLQWSNNRKIYLNKHI